MSSFALIGITPTPFDKYGNKRKDFIKTALGSEETASWEHFENVRDMYKTYPNHVVISIERNEHSIDINSITQEISALNDYIILLGSEVEGVSKLALGLSKNVYHIPMHGKKESFNVAVTAGIVMYILKEVI